MKSSFLRGLTRAVRPRNRVRYEVDPTKTSTPAPTPPPAAGERRPLTIAGAIPIVTDPERGLYPKPSNHRSDVVRALRHAAAIWGPERPWATIQRAEIRQLGRRRLEDLKARGKVGARGAEMTVGRVLTVAIWLKDEGLIPNECCPTPRKWKQVLRGEAGNPEPKRPRYTIPEMRQLLEHAHDVDPRLGLVAAIGAELRIGQVLRTRRSDVDLEKRTVTIRGVGKKGGTVVELTPGQFAALTYALTEGYLEILERRQLDYCLFPGGKLVPSQHGKLRARISFIDKHLGRRAVGAMWNEAERLAGIEHIPGRACYGVRRVAVDGFLEMKISPKALQAAGGWSDINMPTRVYAARDLKFARKEAAELRAKLRGEVPNDDPRPNGSER